FEWEDGVGDVQYLLHRADWAVGVGRVHDHRDRLVGDRGVHQAVLLVGVTLMGADGGAVSQLLGLRGGEIALGLPVRVGRIFDDDGDQTTLAPARSEERSVGN